VTDWLDQKIPLADPSERERMAWRFRIQALMEADRCVGGILPWTRKRRREERSRWINAAERWKELAGSEDARQEARANLIRAGVLPL
jgi:hypothetical protein